MYSHRIFYWPKVQITCLAFTVLHLHPFICHRQKLCSLKYELLYEYHFLLYSLKYELLYKYHFLLYSLKYGLLYEYHFL